MVTTTGKADLFSDAIKELIELELATKEAYNQAIAKISDNDYRAKLTEFLQDHLNHIAQFSHLLTKHNIEPPTKPNMVKPIVAKVKVTIADLVGDQAILAAMASNEEDPNKAYERLNARHDQWEDAKELLKNGLQDEKHHKAWLDQTRHWLGG